MPSLRHSDPGESFVLRAKVNHLRLLCRFDFRQKAWALPGWESWSNRPAWLVDCATALAASIAPESPDFSDPTKGGNPHPGTPRRRTGFRRALPRSRTNNSTTNLRT